MKDLNDITLSEVLSGPPRAEDLPEGQRATAIVLQAMAPEMADETRKGSGELALGWRKWGLPFAKDMAAWIVHGTMTREAINDPARKARLLAAASAPKGAEIHDVIGPTVGALIREVDWDIVGKIMEEHWKAYRAARRRAGTDRGIAGDIAGIEYGLARRGIPDVHEPGDLHDQLTGDWRGKRPKHELS